MSERPNPKKALTPSAESGADREGRGVVDPAWEHALLRGRELDDADAAGSLEPELATLHLLRHVREPEPFAAAQIDATWADIDLAIAPAKKPFWRSAWFMWLAPAGAAAAIAFIVVQGPGAGEAGAQLAYADTPAASQPTAGAPSAPQSAPGAEAKESAARSESAPPPPAAEADSLAGDFDNDDAGGSTSALLEQQFKMLEPQARAKVGESVDTERGSMRAALIAQARGGGK